MTTQIVPDTTTIEDLDFAISCCGEHSSVVLADWMVVWRCGHSYPYCDGHWRQILDLSEPGVVVIYSCSRCPDEWLTVEEAVVNYWRIT